MNFLNPRAHSICVLLLRIIIAAIFFVYGWMKLSAWSAPEANGMVWLTRFLFVVELIGGVAVLVGFLTRWAALGLGIIMVGAVGFLISGQFGPQAAQFVNGWSFPLAILAACLGLMATGGGRWSVDAMMENKKSA